MSNISYSYEIIAVNTSMQCMEVVFSSPGLPSMHVGTRMPRLGEPLAEVMAQYAPVPFWRDLNAQYADPGVGTVGSYTPPEPEPVTLASAKTAKLAQIAEWRWMREVGGVVMPPGITIRTDRESQAQITSAFTTLKEGFVPSVDFKAAGGVWVQITLAEITPIAATVAAHVQECFSMERQLAAQVEAATTIEAVEAIDPDAAFPEQFGSIPSTEV